MLTTLFNGLRHYLPGFFAVRHNGSDQPLLDTEEILTLRNRMLSRLTASPTQSTPPLTTAHKRIGDNPSLHRGYSMDYEESRPYQPGDETRYMNWQLTARTGELYMKVFREERRPGVFILIDRRNSMRFGTRKRLKVTQAARAATCIAFAAEYHHAALGAVILEAGQDAPRWLQESFGDHAAFDVIHAASAPCPPVNHHLAGQNNTTNKATDFGQVLSMLHATLTQGTMLYLISDFIDLAEQHRPRLLQLSMEHQVHAVQISDPVEQYLPRMGRLRLQSPNDTGEAIIDTAVDATHRAYAKTAAQHFAAHKQLFRAANISYTRLSTTVDAIEAEFSALHP